MSSIDWRHDGRRLILPIAILPPLDGAMLRFERGVGLLDTGAVRSGITRGMARRLGLTSHGKGPMAGVHGEQQTARYGFRIGFFADDAVPASLPFVFDDSDGFEIADTFRFDALIGMDVLSQCDFQMNRRGDCSLRFGYA